MIDGKISGWAIPVMFVAIIVLEFWRRLRRGPVPAPEEMYKDPSSMMPERNLTTSGVEFTVKTRRLMLQTIALVVLVWLALDLAT